MSYKDDLLCKNIVSTSRPLQLIHLDLFGQTRTMSINGKRYRLVKMDDYSRWTWVIFLNHKDESFDIFFKFCKLVLNEKGVCVTSLEVIMGENLKMTSFQLFCEENGTPQNFSYIIELNLTSE